jgi:hypothetical protein
MMEQYLIILELATQGKLPKKIDNASNISVTAVQELINAGYLKAINASSLHGPAYIEPKITLAGREYLVQLKETTEEKQMEAKKHKERMLDSATAISTVTDPWMDIEKEYGVSKRAYAKKINFVKDTFKKQVIFRDIEQAYLLAHYGFNKPSVVLAGGVIEELLRLYLAHKNCKPAKNNLDSYIKACEDNRLLKSAIHKLADSVRQFRNIVHLEMESSPKHTISKSTAKGAVSSVFTIANDFDT